MIQHRHGEIVVVGVHPLGHPGGGEQGIGFIGEGEDHIQLPHPHAPELLQQAQAVDQMPEVEDQGQNGHVDQGRPGGQELHPHVLPRPGVDGQGHEKGPDKIVPDGLQHQPEGDADGQIPHQHRHGGREGGGKGAAVHATSPHCEK